MFVNYLQNNTELEEDLGRSISCKLDLKNELSLTTPGQEFFYKLMCKIFGGVSPADEVMIDNDKILYDKSFMISDFKILSHDGNIVWAIALRGNGYIMFVFEY